MNEPACTPRVKNPTSRLSRRMRGYRPASVLQLTLPLTTVLTLLGIACGQEPAPLTAEVPLHLEDHLAVSRITGSKVPDDLPEPVEWRFDQPQPEWKSIVPLIPSAVPATVEQTADSLRITLTEKTDAGDWGGRPNLWGGVYLDLPNWQRGGLGRNSNPGPYHRQGRVTLKWVSINETNLERRPGSGSPSFTLAESSR